MDSSMPSSRQLGAFRTPCSIHATAKFGPSRTCAPRTFGRADNATDRSRKHNDCKLDYSVETESRRRRATRKHSARRRRVSRPAFSRRARVVNPEGQWRPATALPRSRPLPQRRGRVVGRDAPAAAQQQRVVETRPLRETRRVHVCAVPEKCPRRSVSTDLSASSRLVFTRTIRVAAAARLRGLSASRHHGRPRRPRERLRELSDRGPVPRVPETARAAGPQEEGEDQGPAGRGRGEARARGRRGRAGTVVDYVRLN